MIDHIGGVNEMVKYNIVDILGFVCYLFVATNMKGFRMIEEKTCKRCGYKWYPLRPVDPKVCPNCNNRKWNEEKKDKK